MEWVGFWFEYFIDDVVLTKTSGLTGPKFGRTQFDLMLGDPWDLKAHPKDIDEVILNDVDAVNQCISQYGSINYFLLSGDVSYDDEEQTFKHWHDSMKGKVSKYVERGIASGRTSRRRKTAFRPKELLGVQVDAKSLKYGLSSGAITYFQKGMKNSNGNPRNAKYKICLDKTDDRITQLSQLLTPNR